MISPNVLTHNNFILFAMKAYDNPHCMGLEEFFDDLRRVKHIKKLLTRYERTGELKERLILNHIITLSNVFGPEATTKILFLKVNKHLQYIKPFLILLNMLPSVMFDIEKEGPIHTDDLPMDQGVIDALRNL